MLNVNGKTFNNIYVSSISRPFIIPVDNELHYNQLGMQRALHCKSHVFFSICSTY